jgi:hypothetical protein
MKKLSYLLVLFALSLSSCITYNYQSTSSDEAFAKVYCKNPDYITTGVRLVGFIKPVFLNKGKTTDTSYKYILPSDLSISRLTYDAKYQYGQDVTISNVRWDIETNTAFFFFISSQKLGATYDVIRCK